MTKSVGVHEAKTQFSRLLERVAGGEEITITRRGEEVARLVPAPGGRRRRRLGVDRGRFTVPDGFDDPLDRGGRYFRVPNSLSRNRNRLTKSR